MNYSIGITDILRISPFIVLFIASLFPITVKVLRGNIEQAYEATLTQGLGGILSAALLLLTVCMVVSQSDDPTAFANALVFDGLTLWIGLIALFSGLISLLLLYDNPSTNKNQFSEIVFLVLNAIIGMLVVVSAVDLLITFIGIEMMSLSFYLMIAMSNEQKLSKEAAIKYFILGGVASAFLLYGISLIFGTVMSTYIPNIILQTPHLVGTSRLFIFGIALFLFGIAFKISIFPFHAWTPDVYQGAPTPLSAFLATAAKAVIFGTFIRLISTRILIGSDNLLVFLQWLAVITMIVGNTGAIVQTNFKRMLAYSSIAHSGYLLVGIITTGISNQMTFVASGVIFYLFAYSVMTIGAFAIVSLLEQNENHVISIESLAGQAKEHPYLSFALTIILLSLAGIPPLIGFFGKFYLFSAAIGEGLLWLVFWGLINSVISLYYYIRPIVYMYMKEGTATSFSWTSMTASRLSAFVMAAIVLFFGLFSGLIFEIIEKALSY